MIGGFPMANLGHWDPHGAYRYQAMIAGKKVKCRNEQVPNWEVEVGRGLPWFANTELEYDDDRGVNGAGIFYEWVTDDVFGRGYPEALLLQSSFENVRTRIDDFRISPFITDRQDFRSQVATLFEYFDLWARNTDGLIELGQWEHGAIDIGSLPHIGPDDYVEEPDLTPSDFDDCVSKVTVVFSDREHSFKERPSQPYYNPNIFRITGEPRDVVLRRPWITDAALANRYAVEYGTMQCRPLISGSVKIRRDRARALGIRAGNLFVLDWASRDMSIVMRCKRRQWPAFNDQAASLTVENERGIWPSIYVPPPVPVPGNFVVSPTAIVHERIVELPSALRNKNALQVAVLAQRPSDSVTAFVTHVSRDDDVYDIAAPRNNFAAYGRVVNAAYPAVGPVLDTATGIQVEIFGVDNIGSQTDTQRDDRNLLLFVNGEIMSVGQVTPLGAGKYRIYVHRSLYGSTQSFHAIDSECFFIYRNNITPIDNRIFVAGETCFFKLQPYSSNQEYDLTLISAIEHTFASGPFLLSGLEIKGQGGDYAFTGRNPTFAWRLSTLGGVELSGPDLNVGNFDDQFAYFICRVRDVDSGDVVFQALKKDPEYTFLYEDNALSAGGPRRHFLFGVSAVARAIDGSPEQTPFEEIEVENPPPVGLGGAIAVNNNSFYGMFTPSLELDFAGFLIWRSLDLAFEVTDPLAAGVELVYDSPSPNFSIPQPEGTTYYYKSALYDDFGKAIAGLAIGPTPPLSVATVPIAPTGGAPSIAPGSQSFTDPFDVVMSEVAGLTLRFTSDGTNVQSSAAVWNYSAAFTVDKTMTIKARYYGADGTPSEQAEVHYTLVSSGAGGGACAAVSIRFSGRKGHTSGTITLVCSTPDSTIFYSLDGAAYETYIAPFALGLDQTVDAYAGAHGFADGPVSSFDNAEIVGGGLVAF
jgi:hypothetical protein